MDKTLEGLNSIVELSDEDKKNIKEWYNKLYSHEYELSRKNYNPIDIIRD